MSLFEIRKIATYTEEIHHDFGPPPAQPARKGAAMAVVTNPYVGRYVADLSPAMDELKALGERLGAILIDHLGGDKTAIEGYGKGAIVGADGEIEHGAIWHIAGGWPMRSFLPQAKSIVPAAKVVASAGTRLQVPLHHIEACYVRSHFNAVDVGVIDGPRPDELFYTLVMATGGRVHERLGGLRASEIKVGDGQR